MYILLAELQVIRCDNINIVVNWIRVLPVRTTTESHNCNYIEYVMYFILNKFVEYAHDSINI